MKITTTTPCLRERRRRIGMSQGDLGRLAGITRWPQVAVSKVETRDGPPHWHRRKIRMAIIRIERERGPAWRTAHPLPEPTLSPAEAQWQAERDAEAAEMQRNENRIATQRALWAAVPPSPELEALKRAMFDRALELLNDGRPDETDAIVEWLPEADVTQAFNDWLDSIERPAATEGESENAP